MSQHPIMESLAAKLQRKDLPEINPGDTVRVQVKIKEGDKERVQAFEGTVISLRNGHGGSFTVRKVNLGVEREDAFQPGAPRQAVLPARAEGQGRTPARGRSRAGAGAGCRSGRKTGTGVGQDPA